MIGDNIPYRRFGYPSLEDFFQFSPDVCRISRQSAGNYDLVIIGGSSFKIVDRYVHRKNSFVLY